MNLAALIGEVASDVEGPGDEATFRLAVSRGGGEVQVLGVRATGRQAEACRAYLRPGHRVAVEGRVAPQEEVVEVLADRVQFLTTRAQAALLAEAGPEASADGTTPRRGRGAPGPGRAGPGPGRRSGAAAGATR